jgi:copper chaperone CopZ
MPEVVLDVEMACSGCSGAVERVLKKLEGGYLCTA